MNDKYNYKYKYKIRYKIYEKNGMASIWICKSYSINRMLNILELDFLEK